MSTQFSLGSGVILSSRSDIFAHVTGLTSPSAIFVWWSPRELDTFLHNGIRITGFYSSEAPTSAGVISVYTSPIAFVLPTLASLANYDVLATDFQVTIATSYKSTALDERATVDTLVPLHTVFSLTNRFVLVVFQPENFAEVNFRYNIALD